MPEGEKEHEEEKNTWEVLWTIPRSGTHFLVHILLAVCKRDSEMQSSNVSKKGGKKELNEQLAISVKVEIIYFGSVSHSIECGFEGWSILWYGFGGWVFFLSTEIFNEKFSLFRTW